MDAPYARTRPELAEMRPAPLPEDTILDGSPEATATYLTRPEKDGLAVGMWECGPGSFRYAYSTDETVMIAAGSARVTDERGNVVVLREGDWATFRAGDVAVWEIDEHCRKMWVTVKVGRLHSRVLLKGRVVKRRVTTRHGRIKPAIAALGGSSAGFAGAVTVLPI